MPRPTGRSIPTLRAALPTADRAPLAGPRRWNDAVLQAPNAAAAP